MDDGERRGKGEETRKVKENDKDMHKTSKRRLNKKCRFDVRRTKGKWNAGQNSNGWHGRSGVVMVMITFMNNAYWMRRAGDTIRV